MGASVGSLIPSLLELGVHFGPAFSTLIAPINYERVPRTGATHNSTKRYFIGCRALLCFGAVKKKELSNKQVFIG